jgi:hypothetical protein
MIEFIPFDEPSVLGFRISGRIEQDDIALVIEKATQRFADDHDGKIRVYVEVESFTGISLEALFEDLSFGLRNLRNYRRFDRKAVVSGVAWYTKLTPFFDRVFKSVQLKHFTPDQKEDAKAWITN